MKCYKCGGKAIAVVNKNYPMCRRCSVLFQEYCLANGKMLGISLKGVPQLLVVPKYKGPKENNAFSNANSAWGMVKLATKAAD